MMIRHILGRQDDSKARLIDNKKNLREFVCEDGRWLELGQHSFASSVHVKNVESLTSSCGA
jgi:hypothetical protein